MQKPSETISFSVAADPTSEPSITPTSSPSPSLTPSPTKTITPSPSPTQIICDEAIGRIDKGEIRTGLLRLPLDYRIYLPPCYDQYTDRGYPVLYLIHGQSFNDDQWDRLGVDEAADELISDEEISPLIIVMPRDRLWSQPTEDLFGQAVIEILVPWIDQNYRTLPDRDHRAIGGLSRGAGWALHIGFSQWESFGTIGMHSLPVFWTDLPHIKQWLDAIPRRFTPRIYMDLGDKDRPQITKSAIWFEELLTEKKIPHEWHLYPGYHEEAYWEDHMVEYLRWYTQKW